MTANDCSSCVDPYFLQIIKCVLVCDSGFYIYGKSCVLECPSETYPVRSNYQCILCVSPCATCSSETICLSCVSGYYLDGENCVLNCSSNTLYPDDATGTCK